MKERETGAWGLNIRMIKSELGVNVEITIIKL